MEVITLEHIAQKDPDPIKALVMPYQDNLVSLIGTDEFRNIVDESLLRRMDFIRKTGNAAAHAGRKITREQAALCLENLFIFLDFVAYCYERCVRWCSVSDRLLCFLASLPRSMPCCVVPCA